MATLRGGLIQVGLKGSTSSDPETIRKAMIADLPTLIEAAKLSPEMVKLVKESL